VKALHRFRFVLLVVTGVALVAATVYTLQSSNGPRDVAGHLGPTPGPDSEGHIRAQTAYLDRLAIERPAEKAAALVSLSTYVAAKDAEKIARSMDATVVFVKFPQSEQELQFVRSTMTNALAARSTDLRHEIVAEVDALKAQAAKASGKEKQDLESLISQRNKELPTIKADCACVFAFAVEGASLQALRDLAHRPEVRLVDVPNPVTDDLAGWELGPIVPSPKPT
jgi:hypothetical protein